ncbi:MAG: DNA-binding protein WhiA [Oscillospiraceae bacterium]|nr:DNA-binding protein WhiA [Oscillospiraceae bacterium]
MSFSSDIKKSLAALLPEKDCCLLAEAYGLLECGREFSGCGIELQTENAYVAKRYATLVKLITGAEVQTTKSPKYYLARIPASQREQVLARFGHRSGELSVRLNRANFDCDDCVGAYLRGLFLACGTVTNPQVDYHLELCVPHYTLCGDVAALLREKDIPPKRARRGGGELLYVKESELIEDFLTLIGATAATLEMMNIKIVKDIRNTANRQSNCDAANIARTVDAAAAQCACLKRLADAAAALDGEDRELLLTRLDNPTASLRELSELLSYPLSRSGVYHRLQKLLRQADEL